jgi:hypothetical protein
MTAKKKIIRDIENQAGGLFVAGFGIAMVELIKLHGHDEMARDVILSAGFDLEHFRAARMERADIAILKKALAQ